jgi:hypothetical protein
MSKSWKHALSEGVERRPRGARQGAPGTNASGGFALSLPFRWTATIVGQAGCRKFNLAG